MAVTSIRRKRGGAGRGRALLSRVRPLGRVAEIVVVAAVFGVLLVVAFAPVVVGDRMFGPNGRLPTQSGVAGADFPYAVPERAVVNDGGALAWFFEPMAKTAHDAYADGVLPLWNPYAGLGMPLAANFQSAPAGPFTLLVVARPTQDTWDIMLLLRLLVGGVGCFALLRALGAGPGVAFVVATGYLLSSNFVLWLSSVALSVEALVPWLLLAILGLVRRPGAARFAAVALLTAAIALGGQPESLVVAAYVAGTWALYWLVREGRSLRALAELAAAAVVGGLLAAPILLLSAEYVTLAFDAHEGRLGGARLDRALLPEVALGDFADRRQAAVGLVLLALAAAGVAGRRRAGVAGGGVLLVATGAWAVRALSAPGQGPVGLLPGIDSVNIRRYGLFLVVLTAAVLAAAGLQAIVRGSRLSLAVGAGAAVGVPALAWILGVSAEIARPALVLGGVLAAGLATAARVPGLTPLLALVVVAQFALLTPRDYAREHDPFEPRAFVAYLQETLAPGERVTAVDWIMRPQYPSALGLPDPRALDALYPERYARYMRLVAGADRPSSGLARNLDDDGVRSPLLAALGVRYAVTPGTRRVLGAPYEPVYSDAFERRTLTVWRNPLALPRAWSPSTIVSVPDADGAEAALAARTGGLERFSVVERPTPAMRAARGTATAVVEEADWHELRLRVDARGNAVVVVSDQLYPGWKATVDGEETEIRPANLAMRAVVVPDGEHELVFRYRPATFTVGVALAFAGLLALLGRVAVPLAARRRYQLRGVASAPSSTSGGGSARSREAR